MATNSAPITQRERVQPAGDGIAGGVADRHPARRDRADDGAHEERREQRREPEEALGERAGPAAAARSCGTRSPSRAARCPSAARLSGMNSVEKIAANAAEKPVQSTTRTKISQTWLASQTGPIAQSISSRARRPRSPPPATRLQKPAPKSAPPNTAYAVTPIHSTAATASALLTAAPSAQRPAAADGP